MNNYLRQYENVNNYIQHNDFLSIDPETTETLVETGYDWLVYVNDIHNILSD